MTNTVSALYDTHAQGIAAIGELESVGVSQVEISIVSNNVDSSQHDMKPDVGGEGSGGFWMGLSRLAIPGVGPVVAAGWLSRAETRVGARPASIADGLVGALTQAGVTEGEANFFAEGVRRGGTLVAARVRDGAETSKSRRILQMYKAVGPMERVRAYRKEGWTSFNLQAVPLTPEELVVERSRRYGTR